ncbi:hypothetical protein CC78DRAFT_569320 [Lojkania enalia]|uniref:Uncharacterized protein n=1 Tax=Lojkania enalia TaxID=147567 RepID=A0A9P4K529_9PLEO|nr:hypothetical protein CC78DRAFT_569320 [Didymosphaeria enalia]
MPPHSIYKELGDDKAVDDASPSPPLPWGSLPHIPISSSKGTRLQAYCFAYSASFVSSLILILMLVWHITYMLIEKSPSFWDDGMPEEWMEWWVSTYFTISRKVLWTALFIFIPMNVFHAIFALNHYHDLLEHPRPPLTIYDPQYGGKDICQHTNPNSHYKPPKHHPLFHPRLRSRTRLLLQCAYDVLLIALIALLIGVVLKDSIPGGTSSKFCNYDFVVNGDRAGLVWQDGTLRTTSDWPGTKFEELAPPLKQINNFYFRCRKAAYEVTSTGAIVAVIGFIVMVLHTFITAFRIWDYTHRQEEEDTENPAPPPTPRDLDPSTVDELQVLSAFTHARSSFRHSHKFLISTSHPLYPLTYPTPFLASPHASPVLLRKALSFSDPLPVRYPRSHYASRTSDTYIPHLGQRPPRRKDTMDNAMEGYSWKEALLECLVP